MIPALILTAGFGTRLRPLSLVRAKPAVPVAGQLLVVRILGQLSAGGVSDAVLNLHHLPHTITREVGDGAHLGMRVRYSWETPILGSAGGPRQALPLLASPTFLIANGDTLTTLDLPALIDAHRRSGALVTMAVAENTEPEKYGGVVVDSTDAVTAFAGRGSSHQSWHFLGVQVAEAAAFAGLAAGTAHESVAEVYPALIGSRAGSVRAHRCQAAFLDIGTPRDYVRTSLLIARRDGDPLTGRRTHVDPTADVEASVLWDDVRVGAGSRLQGCIVTDGVRVPDGTSWTDAAIRPAIGALLPGERRVGDLAITAI
ncbi:MAG: sugar phosphate nucleotidyltransferase [Acidobacteria bacterium]|nr:sugar phosphate nucleotidyltransferase [Acidobacteriota bacterium]